MTGCNSEYYDDTYEDVEVYEPAPLACDRQDVTDLLASLFNKSKTSMFTGVTVFSIDDVEDISGMGGTLSCRANLQLSNDKTLRVAYTVSPTSDSEYWLEYIPLG